MEARSLSLMHLNLDQDGFAIIPDIINREERQTLLAALGPVSGAGRRGLLRDTKVAALAHSPRLLGLVRPHLPAEPLPVRAIYFDKSPDANWLVPWHQDLTLALREQGEVSGFGPWSMKDEVPHVQPPVELLEKMLTIRLHLDDTDESNGALRVLPGSHRLGRLSANQIKELRSSQPDFLCRAKMGDALLMRPLLLHASSRSTSSEHRRILHIEYAAFELPEGLHWHESSNVSAPTPPA
jgi:ectoine hydroxylase-related dioxygenase (phytanoyl-CoA dioxygenase family)